MKLSIIIPVKNEESLIQKVIEELQINLKNLSPEVIFIDDFSTDNTIKVIEELIEDKSGIDIYKNNKEGLGGAITLGINKSNGDVVCIMMSDLSDSIDDLKKYYDIIKNEDVDSVFGSRFIRGSQINNYPKNKLILNRIFNIITNGFK